MRGILVAASLVLMANVVTSSKVLLISMDGFRWDYIQNFSTPNFDAFAKKGVTSKYMRSVFSTKTFPNHYSIATVISNHVIPSNGKDRQSFVAQRLEYCGLSHKGLYEETHGIVSNYMYDPDLDETFNRATLTDSHWWSGGEPLWVTARRHGLKSGVYFWIGSESVIRGIRPNYYKKYDKSVPFTDRVDTAIQWLSNVSLAMVYFHEPDGTGHDFGPYSQEVNNKVIEMDDLLGYIVQRVQEAGLWDDLNVIVTSDHGMAEIDMTNRIIDLRRYIDIDAIDVIPNKVDAVVMFKPKDGMTDEMYRNLSSVSHMTVYRKEDLPEEWHYKNNRRVLPIVLVADEGWFIALNTSAVTWSIRGSHGYDNALSSMMTIFYAQGPDFKSNYTLPPFDIVDIYPLVCKLLGIEPSANNGTLDHTQGALSMNVVSGGPRVSNEFGHRYSLACMCVMAIVMYIS